MTEEEWLTGRDHKSVTDFLRKQTSDRKLRLFGCAMCRQRSHLLGEGESAAIATAEQFADAQLEVVDLVIAAEVFESRRSETGNLQLGAMDAIASVCLLTDLSERHGLFWFGFAALHPGARSYMHDIFGHPFRPVVFEPRWRSETAVALATGIYDERAFDRLPILADALEEAGCDNADVLTHCRGPGPHARGCWVVDGVLGKV